MKSLFLLSAAKNYFLGFATSGTLLFAGLFYFNSKKSNSDFPAPHSAIKFLEAEKTTYSHFDPNLLNEDQWQKLGFSERQSATILKYKKMLGGSFSSKEELKKCYAISETKYNEIAPYILLDESGSSNSSSHYHASFSNKSHYKTKKNPGLKISSRFNPDTFTAQDFENIGFTSKQALSILKYKNYLGGSFQSKEKFRACFVISDENYRILEPLLLLPENTTNKTNNYSSSSNGKLTRVIERFNPNATDLQGWQKLGFSEKQAQVIINYRDRNLKGNFKSLEDIQKCFVISAEKFEEIRPYIILENVVNNTDEKEYSGSSFKKAAQVATDFSTIDLNQITYKQLIEYGFDGKSAAMLLGFRKKLGGFVNTQQILDTYDIDKELASKLVAEAKLDTSSVQKYTLVDAPEEWLKNHPYFKYSADKIIYHRLSYPNERKIWNLIKVKPEYQARMKLYLVQE